MFDSGLGKVPLAILYGTNVLFLIMWAPIVYNDLDMFLQFSVLLRLGSDIALYGSWNCEYAYRLSSVLNAE